MGANNQLHGGYTYDDAGNMIHDATANLDYRYDPENRIMGAGGFTYTYDAEGNRVEKANGTNGTLYWYMTPGIVAESDLAGNLKSEYIFFDGERVARKDFPGNTVSYYFSDHLKTASVITDAAGNIKSESDYYPWGGEVQFTNNNSNRYKFTGKERDSETGLDYFGARYYSNGLGRFITPDWASAPVPVPYADLTDPQSLNQYSYVRNLPTVKTDIDGHCWLPQGVCDFFQSLIQPATDVHDRRGSEYEQGTYARGPGVVGTDTHKMAQQLGDDESKVLRPMTAAIVAFDPTGQAALMKAKMEGDKLGMGLAMAAPFLGGMGSIAESLGFKAGFAVAGNLVGGELTNGARAAVSVSRVGSELGVGISIVKGPAGTLAKLEQGAIAAAKSQGAATLKITATMVKKSMARRLRMDGFTQEFENGNATGNWIKEIKIGP